MPVYYIGLLHLLSSILNMSTYLFYTIFRFVCSNWVCIIRKYTLFSTFRSWFTQVEYWNGSSIIQNTYIKDSKWISPLFNYKGTLCHFMANIMQLLKRVSKYWLKYPHALKFPLIKFFSSKKSYRVFESLQTCYGILLLHPTEKNATKGPDHVF